MRNLSMKLFEFGPVVWEMSFTYLRLWWPFCSMEQNGLCNFGREHYEKHLCEIIFYLD